MWRLPSGTGWVLVALLVGFGALLATVGGLHHSRPVFAASTAAGTRDLDAVDVALDPGHSSWDVGATGAGLAEYRLTLEVANGVRARLEEAGYSVRLTRTDNNRVAPTVPRDSIEATRVEQEARIAAAGPASIYVSIHFNAHPNRGLRGSETYFNGENHRSQSVLLGTHIQNQLLDSLRRFGYQPVDRGVREDLTAGKPYGHFFSLRGPFPSVLVESLFLSNPVEAELLQQESARDAIADGIARGIVRYFADQVGDAGGGTA
jgi:N-acetylmuramoyl-L-alanine amidase